MSISLGKVTVIDENLYQYRPSVRISLGESRRFADEIDLVRSITFSTKPPKEISGIAITWPPEPEESYRPEKVIIE